MTGAIIVFYLSCSDGGCASFYRNLCKNFKECESPFNMEAVQSLRKLAYSLIPMAVRSSAGEYMAISALFGKMEASIGVDVLDCQPGDILEYQRDEK